MGIVCLFDYNYNKTDANRVQS